jgi:hypothetical protein
MRAISTSLIVILSSLLIFQIASAVLRQNSDAQAYLSPPAADPLAVARSNDPM